MLELNDNCYEVGNVVESHGLVVKALHQEVVGSNPGTIYWMDVSDLLAITLKTN
jgi:hypothetical protein